ncbi:MAG: transketolase, partial [Planctomycetes bacterium]|nr:transketolase [Planctomycetota bacterium]
MGSNEKSDEILPQIADTIRCLAMDAVEKARSGHPGMPMGCADFAALLWGKILKHNPKNPAWPDRDRFVLSAGHGSMLLYAVLHLSGYDLTVEDLKSFRQWGSKTPGHPEVGVVPGVETTTGPLGQGFANGVGMAMAEAMLAARFNTGNRRVVDHFTYGIVSDGDLMEGVSAEAASLAGHLKLGKLIYFYDSNRISIDGPTDLSYSDDVAQRFEGYHWHVQRVDGHDLAAMEKAIAAAQRETSRPSIIIGRTHIAKGSPNKQDTSDSHGAPLGEEEIKLTKKAMGWDPEKTFFIPEPVKTFFEARLPRGADAQEKWEKQVDEMHRADPELGKKWQAFMERALPGNLADLLPEFDRAKPVATRAASGSVLNALARNVEQMVGGSADLAPSNKTRLKGEGTIGPGEFSGRNFHFGVREHAMGSIMNGMALHGGFIPYGGTFLVFADYMRPAIRVAALCGLPVIYVFTHDSIFVGEDGPTHQPIEHLAALRAIPDLAVIRPADATETGQAWIEALKRAHGPTALILTRQGLPILDPDRYAKPDLPRGAYILKAESKKAPDLILIASGSEVALALDAAEDLEKGGKSVRVVSMPCWELFEEQTKDYREKVLPKSCKARLAVEAGSSMGWHRYVGQEGATVTIDHFGASAPASEL